MFVFFITDTYEKTASASFGKRRDVRQDGETKRERKTETAGEDEH